MIDIHSGETVATFDCAELARDQLSYVGDQFQKLKQEFNYEVKETSPNFENDRDPETLFKHYSTWDQTNNVFNGIAYRKQDDTFLVTGKMWDHIYQVKLDYRKYVAAKDEL